jgi:hypothetical protein
MSVGSTGSFVGGSISGGSTISGGSSIISSGNSFR